MSELIYIEIPDELREDEWQEHLQERIDEFRVALDLSVGVDPNDHRLAIHGIEIEALEIREDIVFINYVIKWSVYYGCEDKNGGGDEDAYITAQRDGNVLIFKPHVYPEQRSTFDEY